MAYLPQQIASFNAGFPSTVYEFVKSGRYPRQGWFRRLTKHDLEHVQRALESVGMWENRHKQIGRLSGGQKQRIAIARMLVLNKPIIIFDDSLSALDTKTYLQIRNALKQRDEKMTSIIITHRITTAKEADKIIVLENGKVSEIGTHEELAHKPGLYKSLWDIQGALESQFLKMVDKEVNE